MPPKATPLESNNSENKTQIWSHSILSCSLKVFKKTITSDAAKFADEDGNTLLHKVVNSSNKIFAKIKLLLDSDADINAQNKDGVTPISQAVKRAQPDLIKYLLEIKANPNISDNRNNTALHTALEMDQSFSLKRNSNELLAHDGINIFAENDLGVTPFTMIKNVVNKKEYITVILSNKSIPAGIRTGIHDELVRKNYNDYTLSERKALKVKDLVLIKPAIRSVLTHDILDVITEPAIKIEVDEVKVFGALEEE